ncbi:unnamed protein product [Sordaria macrospora k-hell]|uniref:WGS project CABT00000000 data, contig 2.63 n=1 Tax=Sordaria macrospora (strain ATCC MYA-333 / DSM 997 / K(L3346) / K-hell) TaxID=771870 RepID=F7WAL4_SORMK|nr:uncharacterized protein SMAC_08668 [Sordaria macrospora k-hell]CCC14209.1 unnamed protein product [Sordaria macrospora k-hell]
MRAQQDAWKTRSKRNTYYWVLDPKHFCGEVNIERDRLKAIQTVCLAHNSASTLHDITFAMFTDSSRCRRLDRVSAGAYAVVFNCYAPGTEYHGCEVAAGWPVGDKKSHGCEGLAIKQAIKVAFTELTTLEQLLPQGPKAKVKVQIFCDNLRLLQELAGLKNYPVEDIDHIASLQRWSQRFRARFTGGNSPFPAKLQLFWVPAHINEVVLHQKADAMHGANAHGDEYEPRLEEDFEENGSESQEHQEAANLYNFYDGESTLLSQQSYHGGDDGQWMSMEERVRQYQDYMYLWNQWSSEFQHYYQQWYALFFQQFQQGPADEEMGGL